MRLPFILLLAVSISRALCHSTFRFGAVLSTVGSTRTIADAKDGYALYFDAVNALADGNGFFIQGKPETQGFYFKYEFLWREDFSDRRIHADEVQKLLEKDRVHFLGGSHPKYALQEMRLANQSSVLCYHCCVSPDSIYERNFPTTFGITATNKDFTKLLIRQLTFAQISSLAVVYDEDDEFTRTTCEATIAFGREFYAGDLEDRMIIVAFNGSDTSPEIAEEFAQRAKRLKIAAVIGCVYPQKGRQLVHALDAVEYSLQSLFLTVGPSKQWWVNSIENGDLVRDLLSSAQWHESMNYVDDFFGSTAEYVELYKRKYSGASPDQDAAGASAVGLTLTKAITTAFTNCDITQTKGDVDALLYDTGSIACDDGLEMTGYDRILRTLARLDIETFYGKVQFNPLRRNVALDPVTTQVFVRKTGDGEERRKIEAVLPVGYATKLIHYPAHNRYPDTCEAGQHRGKGAFDPCEPCASGTFSEKRNAKHCENCPIGHWLKSPGQSVCNKCPSGTTTNSTGATRKTDCICRVGFFNRAALKGVDCEPCPEGATCKGGIHAPIPNEGYWSSSLDRGEVYRCDSGSVCRGGEDSECAEGYTGRYVSPKSSAEH